MYEKIASHSDALHTSAENGRAHVIWMLLEKGADIGVLSFEYCADEGQTEDKGGPLPFAVDGGNSEILKKLLERVLTQA